MILIVDDSDLILDWMRGVVERAGYYYDSASDATVALYKMERLDYALVITDLILPDFPGQVLARRIRALPEPKGSTPIVAMTGGQPPDEEDKPLFRDCLRKPFLPDQLREAISTYARPPFKDLHAARLELGAALPQLP